MIQVITNNGRKFDLPEDLVISVEENSVMTGKQGSFSLPLELPWSDNNVQLINYPSRIDRRYKFTSQIEVVVSAGVWVRRAMLNVDSVRENTGISCELYFAESRFYQQIQDVKLPDIFADIVRDDYSHLADIESRITAWLTHFEKVQIGEAHDVFYVFPVCAKLEKKEESKTDNGTTITLTYEEYTILNRPDVPSKRAFIADNQSFSETVPYSGVTGTSLTGKVYYKLAARKLWKFLSQDESSLTVYQKGYGVTPFLKFVYILSSIFDKYGYSLQLSEFQASPTFMSLCYINNTADAIMDGRIHYSQLVPDVSVSEFLEHVENSFGVEFIFNEIDATVTPRFWKDLLVQNPTDQIEGVLEDFPQVIYSQPKAVRLSTEKSAIESKLIYETYNELIAKYGVKPASPIPENTFYHVFDAQDLIYKCYQYVKFVQRGQTIYVENLLEKITGFLDYHNSQYEAEEKACGFESVPLVQISMDELSPITAVVDFSKSYLHELGVQTQAQAEDSVLARVPFINSIRHLKTSEVSLGKDSSGNEQKVSESKANESGDQLGVFPCFLHGFAVTQNDAPNVERILFASQYRYNNAGTVVLAFDLSAKGLYDAFWKEYDEMLSTSFHEISGPALLPVERLMALQRHNPYQLHGQSVLPETIRYEITHRGIDVVELKLRTLREYE